MSVIVDGKSLTIENVLNVARNYEKVELHPDALERIKASRRFIEKKIEQKEVMYGVNTGIGELVNVILNDDQIQEFQKYLIYNHAAGFGEPAPIEHIRAAMLSRVNVHAKGYSGCRPEITLTYIEMLNKGVTPVVCEKGSVGACGDLAPMSQCALSLIGEGECFYEGKRMPTKEAMDKAGIKIPGLKARDGLAAINGSNLITGIGSLLLIDAENFTKQAEISAAMTLEALFANMKPYDLKLHQLRGFQGAVKSAENIKAIVSGSDLTTGKVKVKVQDAYSMRSTPQVIGALRDQLKHSRKQFEIELNGVADNPIFVAEEDRVLTGANFQGSPVSLPLDVVGAAITMVCVLSERRLNRLLNSNLSVGLPPFLTKGAGMFSGMMLSQYTADMLVSEQRILSAPAYILSIPAAADQEDFVSMGMNSALKTKQIIKNSCAILGIEFMAAAQALDFRDFNFGNGTKKAHSVIRKYIEHLDVDRPLFKDHNEMARLVESCEILKEVEKEVGGLKDSWS
jgi:histidine ammonia-lyase